LSPEKKLFRRTKNWKKKNMTEVVMIRRKTVREAARVVLSRRPPELPRATWGHFNGGGFHI
jgi:hypothetical protein